MPRSNISRAPTTAVSTPAVAAHPAGPALLLGGLGVVFGDTGTSPIYAPARPCGPLVPKVVPPRRWPAPSSSWLHWPYGQLSRWLRWNEMLLPPTHVAVLGMRVEL
jgi:hypothetical protein